MNITKLPIKRKAPGPSTTGTVADLDFESRPLPFKFQRIWTEPDEIRLLQGLLDSVSLGHSFPKDLSIFFDSFSKSMSLRYSRPPLSEKLRRLRKKFRLISSRLEQGLSVSRLSAHDRALYELCEKLWSPQLGSTSPSGNCTATHSGVSHVFDDSFYDYNYDFSGRTGEMSVDVVGIVAKCVLDAFDQSLNEVRKSLIKQDLENNFQQRWREQRMAELGVLARRMRLVLDNYPHVQ